MATDERNQTTNAHWPKEPHPYTVDGFIVGAEVVPCTVCGGGRNAQPHRDWQADQDYREFEAEVLAEHRRNG